MMVRSSMPVCAFGHSPQARCLWNHEMACRFENIFVEPGLVRSASGNRQKGIQMPNDDTPPLQNGGFIEERLIAAEADRNEAEQFRRLAEEAREVRDQHREALEAVRQEQELLRDAGEKARLAAEDARVS